LRYLSPVARAAVKDWVSHRTGEALRLLDKELTKAEKAWEKQERSWEKQASRQARADISSQPDLIKIIWAEEKLESIVARIESHLFRPVEGLAQVMASAAS
jgi:hypothetical protein